mgnify:CR=1 FL=1
MKKWASACLRRWPGTITISTWVKPTVARIRLRETKKGGLANVVEKAWVRLLNPAKARLWKSLSGTAADQTRLIYAATPASDFVCGTQQVASGITVQVFTTGRGTPYGLMAVPVIKWTTRTELANRWYDLMDINAGTIATGEESIEDVAGSYSTSFWTWQAGGRKRSRTNGDYITSWRCLTRHQ